MDSPSTAPPAGPAPEASAKRPHLIRRLYNWTVAWAERPHGLAALFVIAFMESSFFPIPPDVLLIALCVGAHRRSFKFAAICTAGSVVGGMVGYGIGWGAWQSVRDIFIPYVFSQANFDKVQQLYQGNAFVSILAAAFTPIPYKVFTIAAGVFQVNFVTLVLASIVGRGARFFLVGGTIFLFGPTVRKFLEKHFDWCAIALFVLGVLGFVAIKFLH